MNTHKPKSSEVEEKLIEHLVDRFLGWRLPEDFYPDAGISFEKEYNVSYNAHQGLPPSKHEPVGTNLFTAEQAKEMFRFLLENDDGTSFLTHHTEQVKREVVEEGINKAYSALADWQCRWRDTPTKDHYGIALAMEIIKELITQPNNPN